MRSGQLLLDVIVPTDTINFVVAVMKGVNMARINFRDDDLVILGMMNIDTGDKDTMLSCGAYLNNVALDHVDKLTEKQANILKICDKILTDLAFKL